MPTRRGVRPEAAGRQADRTVLSWERTGLAVLGNGVLLLVRYDGTQPATALSVGLAVFVAGVVAVSGLHRRRRFGSTRSSTTAAVEVRVAGAAVALLGAAVVVVLIASAPDGG